MKNACDIDYRNAVKAKYEIEKSGNFHGFLKNPSPALLRELCLLKFDNGLNRIDEEIFRIYFRINEIGNLRDVIYNYKISKFKAVWKFLIGGSINTSLQNLNLIAVLVDFNPRPYNKFSKTDEEQIEAEIETEVIEKKVLNSSEKEKPETLVTTDYFEETGNKRETAIKKIIKWALLLLGISTTSYTAMTLISPEKECMQWQDDHFEILDCDAESSFSTPIIPIDKKALDLRKIEVCNDSTVFFAGGKPKVWYCKVNGDPEFFNGPGAGLHPVTGKDLNPITPYMIGKYVDDCK